MRLLIFFEQAAAEIARSPHPAFNAYTYYIIEKRKADSKKVGELDFLRYNK